MKLFVSGLTCTVFIVQIYLATAGEDVCGFPGTPAYGYVKPDQDAYEEGDVVSYSCRVGYILIGSPISRCTEDGSWSEGVPICDDSMTTLGVAFSTASVPGYPAEYAIDRDKSTCAKLKEKKPRWWRMDLGNTHKVLSVAITINDPEEHMKFTIYVIRTTEGSASYKRCASFTGKFGTPTMFLSCLDGKGIIGEKVHIEDEIQKGELRICEVEVQVEKNTGYECGRPSRNLNSFTYEPRDKRVYYKCIRGYEIIGNNYRKCLYTGQWSDSPPVCTPILCDELEELENGEIKLNHDGGPILEGTIAIYSCKKGYRLNGTFTRLCGKEGHWTSKQPKCKVIRCPVPDGKSVGGVYRLVNNTNSMGGMALLRCKKGKREGDNPYITCTEDSEWTKPEAKCILPAGTFYEQKEEPRIANQGAIIFGMIVAAIMIVVVLVSMYLYTQKRRNGDKPEIPSRSTEPPAPPPRPPPRGDFKSTFMSLISRDSSDKPEDQKELRNSWYGGSSSAAKHPEDPAVIEVEVIAQEDKRKGVYPVPEESENTSLENVVLDMDDKSSDRAASPKEQKSGSDYAAVDYEKKRQSRLLKDQDSIDSSSTAAASPIPPDESEKKGKSPTPKPASESEAESEEEEEVENESEKQKQEEERKAKEEAERKAKEEEERKAKEEAEKQEKEAAAAPGSRRRRLREEPPAPVVEERPALRRVRQSKFQ